MNDSHLRTFAIYMVILTLISVAGCSTSTQPTSSSGSAAISRSPSKAVITSTSTSAEVHDVCIFSLHLEPAINNDGTVDTLENRTLLVAVDNRGNKTENDITVHLAVKSNEDKDDLISQTQTIAVLAPGKVEVLKFSGLSTLPSRSSYSLAIDISKVAGESNITDNHKTLDLRIQQPQ